MNDTKYNFDNDADETAETALDLRDLHPLDNDPVNNESSFRLSDEIFQRRGDSFEDFENLVDMAGG